MWWWRPHVQVYLSSAGFQRKQNKNKNPQAISTPESPARKLISKDLHSLQRGFLCSGLGSQNHRESEHSHRCWQHPRPPLPLPSDWLCLDGARTRAGQEGGHQLHHFSYHEAPILSGPDHLREFISAATRPSNGVSVVRRGDTQAPCTALNDSDLQGFSPLLCPWPRQPQIL